MLTKNTYLWQSAVTMWCCDARGLLAVCFSLLFLLQCLRFINSEKSAGYTRTLPWRISLCWSILTGWLFICESWLRGTAVSQRLLNQWTLSCLVRFHLKPCKSLIVSTTSVSTAVQVGRGVHDFQWTLSCLCFCILHSAVFNFLYAGFPRLLESPGFFSLKFQDLESPGKICLKIMHHWNLLHLQH